MSEELGSNDYQDKSMNIFQKASEGPRINPFYKSKQKNTQNETFAPDQIKEKVQKVAKKLENLQNSREIRRRSQDFSRSIELYHSPMKA